MSGALLLGSAPLASVTMLPGSTSEAYRPRVRALLAGGWAGEAAVWVGVWVERRQGRGGGGGVRVWGGGGGRRVPCGGGVRGGGGGRRRGTVRRPPGPLAGNPHFRI